MNDKIFTNGIYSDGYGIIAKSVMRNKNLSVEAKAIYSYLVSFSGAGLSSFPSTELILSELGISNRRYLSHRKTLEELGYLVITRERVENGFSRNKYMIVSDLSVSSHIVQLRGVHEHSVTVQNVDTISNSLKSNNLISNSNIKPMVDFDKFWELYPNKKAKGQAIKKFSTAVKDKETYDLIIEDLNNRHRCKDWQKEKGKFIPYPSTYLNAMGWLDEYETVNDRIVSGARFEES